MEDTRDDANPMEIGGEKKRKKEQSRIMDFSAEATDPPMLPADERKLGRLRRRERLLAKVHEILEMTTKPIRDIILEHALHHLPARSLLRFQSVSTAWYRHISRPLFFHLQSHTHRSISGVFHHRLPDGPVYSPFQPAAAHAIPDPQLNFLPHAYDIPVQASSNGLICCRGTLHSYYVCNPTTTEWTTLPEPPLYQNADSTFVALVFEPSFHNLEASYRLIRAHEIEPGCKGIYGFQIFSSETGQWTDGAELCPAEELIAGSGVSANGKAYWRTSMQTVVAYDPASGGCRIIQWPMGYREARWQLGELDKKCCCVGVTETTVEVHALEPSDRWSLLKSYSIVDETRALKQMDEEEVEWSGFGGDEAVFKSRPWPLRFQSGNLEVLLWVDGRIIGLDIASGRVTELCVATGSDWGPSCYADYVSHISTFARVFPQRPHP